MAKIPPANYTSIASYLNSIYPGIGFCVCLGAAAKWLDQLVPANLLIINYVLISILLGLLARNAFSLPAILDEGIGFSSKIFLYIGIVLLGAGLNLVDIISVGLAAIFMVAISITFSIAFCGWLAVKIGKNRRWGHLVGTGIGICGVSAIIALAPVIKAREKEIFTAIGAALLVDLTVLLFLPTVGHSLGWSDNLAGFFAGGVSSNTAQSIAIGHAYSDAAGAIATIVKSVRNTLMPVVILALTFLYTKKNLPLGEKARAGLLWTKFPKFIIGLLAAAVLRTAGVIPDEGVLMARELSSWFFVVCFVGIGAGINLKELGRQDMFIVGFGFIMTLILGLYVYLYSTYLLFN